MTKRFIVGEISKTWMQTGVDLDHQLLAEKFEAIIDYNVKRGYRLHSWRLTSCATEPEALTETIIAVFEANQNP